MFDSVFTVLPVGSTMLSSYPARSATASRVRLFWLRRYSLYCTVSPSLYTPCAVVPQAWMWSASLPNPDQNEPREAR